MNNTSSSNDDPLVIPKVHPERTDRDNDRVRGSNSDDSPVTRSTTTTTTTTGLDDDGSDNCDHDPRISTAISSSSSTPNYTEQQLPQQPAADQPPETDRQRSRAALYHYYNNGNSFRRTTIPRDSGVSHSTTTTTRIHNDDDDDDDDVPPPPPDRVEPHVTNIEHDDDDDEKEEEDDIVAQLLRQAPPRTNVTTNSTHLPPHVSLLFVDDDITTVTTTLDDDDLPVTRVPGRYATTTFDQPSPLVTRMMEVDPTGLIGQPSVRENDPMDHHGPAPPHAAFVIDSTVAVSQSHWMHHSTDDRDDGGGGGDDDDSNNGRSIRNCYGVVHVRVLRAQRLSCPVHSTLSIIYKLYPWQGKVRSHEKGIKTFVVPPSTIPVVHDDATTTPRKTRTMEHGVCAQWLDPNPTNQQEQQHPFVKMIHAYSDPLSSPIPTIQIDLVFNPIPFIEFTMCSFHIDCTLLFQHPNRIHTQWFTAITSSHQNSTTTTAATTTTTTWIFRRPPPTEIEAMFEPAVTDVSSLLHDVTEIPPHATTDDDDDATMTEDHNSEHHDQMAGTTATPALVNTMTDAMEPVLDLDREPWEEHPETDDDGMSMTSIHTSKTAFTNATTTTCAMVPLQQHLLQISSFRFTPAFCCVCGKSLLSLSFLSWNRTIAAESSPSSSTSSWRCERCSVDCCDDCRLQVDVSLPCGSDLATTAVSNAMQNKLTIDKILNTVAPTSDGTRTNNDVSSDAESPQVVDDHSERTIPDNIDVSVDTNNSTVQGIGILKICLQRAHILKDPLPAETDPMSIVEKVHPHLRSGDYYVRIHWSGGGDQVVTVGDREQTLTSVRTRTIQRSSGQLNFSFDNEIMRFVVSHYGMEYRIDVIDAATDKAIGTGLITTQGLLQQQRDYLVEEKRLPFLSFLLKPILFTDMRRIVIELRAALKNGYSNDFYSPIKSRASLPDGEVHTGDIVGCMELTVCLEENFAGIFAHKPYVCPPRPGEDLNMSVFQLHLQRISNILEDFKQINETYKFVVGWKNPVVTGISLVIFLRLCVWFDPAYTGSLPVFLAIVLMLYLASLRAYGTMKAKFTQKEIEKYRKAENGIVNYDVHRPVGLVRLNILKGRNIRSPELGLAGNVACRVSLDLIRFMPEKQRRRALELDFSMSATHEFGSTSFAFGTEPVWDGMIKNDRATRMTLLLPHLGTFFDSDEETNDIAFPLLQPISTTVDLQVLDPWESSAAAVVIEVRLSDLLNVIPGSEYALGEVVIPLRDLVAKGEVSGWFNVVVTSPNSFLTNQAVERLSENEGAKTDSPQLYLTINWNPPPRVSTGSFLEIEREASYAIQEEMIRSAVLARSQKEKVNILVSSIGALNNVRGISANLQSVQNQLGWALDFIESCLHLFDFTDPFKSSLILLALFILWLILSVISTRMIILTLGLAQYSLTLKARIDRWLRSGRSSTRPKMDVAPTIAPSESPFMTWFVNAIRGLPTSEDLRKIYFWESRRKGAQESEMLSVAKRKVRMQRLWRVQWYGTALMLLFNKKSDSSEWRTVFVLVQGHRILWWRSIHDFDNGIAPLGRLLLAGHAGLSSPSPLELREMNTEEMDRVVCIFGSGSRVTLLAPSIDTKLDLENVIEAALYDKQD